MNVYKIPLDNVNQIFEIDLAGTTYKMRVYYNPVMMCWCFDLLDINDNAITQGQSLVTGANILDQYEYLGLGGVFVVYTEGDENAIPTHDNLGDVSNLYFLTNN